MADISSLPFPRKYRPTTLKKYIGNDKNKETIMNLLSINKRPQVVLLYGASGCGKTSFARLMAKEYSCYDRDDNLGACGVCDNCVSIDEYISTGDTSILTNIREVDVTNQSGKRDLELVFEEMMVPAFGDEWKIYIFDECHKATEGLQNRMLKIFEEPPEHVLIILCTTNPELLIETLKNRCELQMSVKKPTVKELAGLLKYVCQQEGVDYDTKGLEFIANRDELTIRTALNSLQLVINERGSAKYEDATAVFDEVSDAMTLELFRAMKAKDPIRYTATLSKIKSKIELGAFFKEMQKFVERGIYTINGIQLDGVSDKELESYRELFGTLGISQIASFLNKLHSINLNNIELELLMLGYTGFDSVVAEQRQADVLVIEDELSKESSMATQILKDEDDAQFNQGVENASKSMDAVDIDALLSMGGMLVKE